MTKFVDLSKPKQAARITANALPVVRVGGGIWTAEQLKTNRLHPESRDWKFASTVLTFAGTDVFDGILARYAGTTRLGGYLDQFADKAWFLTIARQLAKNGEIPDWQVAVPAARDVAVSAIRPLAQHYGLSSDAKLAGKVKMWGQVAAVGAACSPVAYESPETIEFLFGTAAGASLVSGIETARDYTNELAGREISNRAAQFIVASANELYDLAA